MFFPGVLDQVYIATGATDMRKSINGLSIMIPRYPIHPPPIGFEKLGCNLKGGSNSRIILQHHTADSNMIAAKDGV